MEDSYVLGQLLYREDKCALEVREARYHLRGDAFPSCQSDQQTFIVKSYTCTDANSAETLLKTALHLIKWPTGWRLIDVILDKPDLQGQSFTVNYVLAGGVDEYTLKRDDTQSLLACETYEVIRELRRDPHSESTVSEAHSSLSQEPVAIKVYRRSTVLELNPAVREFVTQARVAHRNSCRVVDVTLKQEDKFEFGLVLEMMTRSLNEDIALQEAPYSEEKLLSCIEQVASVLLHAKLLGITHYALIPANIFLAPNGLFKVASFGSCRQETHSTAEQAIGVSGDLIPEYRASVGAIPSTVKKGSFPEDVYSLGIAVLCMAMCRQSTAELFNSFNFARTEQELHESISSLSYSDFCKKRIAAMTNCDPALRPTLEDLCSGERTDVRVERIAVGEETAVGRKRRVEEMIMINSLISIEDDVTEVS